MKMSMCASFAPAFRLCGTSAGAVTSSRPAPSGNPLNELQRAHAYITNNALRLSEVERSAGDYPRSDVINFDMPVAAVL